MSGLVLGPMLRHVDETSASVWVQTRSEAQVSVRAGPHEASARTFRVHGHHYALVELAGLEPGTRTPYRVLVDGHQVWPELDSPYPPSVIPTLRHDQRLRLAFGSCRVSVPHDAEHTEQYGVDAMRAFALHLAGEGGEWPDLLLLLGDQVYADETSDEIRAFIEERRGLDEPPGAELQGYVEYAELYRLAWIEPANRWLLSTVPSAMIFDDHDIRDDWNTSWTWRQEMAATDWWHDRIVGGLASYWVYQHLGNLGPAERAEDEMWRRVASHQGPDELDLTAELDRFAERTDAHPDTYRWSFARDIGAEHVRLVVVDSRAARVLTPEQRSMIDESEMTWLREKMHGGFDHLLVGTSLPFLLAPGLHHAEAFSEGLCTGAWGRTFSRVGEWLRQVLDMEHWAAFQKGFRDVSDMTLAVASGELGDSPHTITFLSGDVHHSYVAFAEPDPRVSDRPVRSRIVQAVCSPIRNPLPRGMQRVTTWGTRRWVSRLPRRLARMARVPASPLRWTVDRGPWYDNNLAVLESREDGRLAMTWYAGDVGDRRPEDPTLRTVAEVEVPPSGSQIRR